MKFSHKLTTILVGGSLALLPIPALAQSTGVAPGSGASTSGAGSATSTTDRTGTRDSSMVSPDPGSPVHPTTPPYDPSVSGSPSGPLDRPAGSSSALDPTTRSSSSTSTASSLSPDSAYADDTPVSPSSARGPANSRNRVDTPPPWVGRFTTIDTNQDGRISLAEFTAPSGNWLPPNSTAVIPGAPRGASNSVGAVNSPSTTVPPSTATPGTSTGGSAFSSSSPVSNNTQIFYRLDTNHDGYLTQAELDAYRTRPVTP